MLKLKLQYFGHLIQRANSLEKTLMLGKIEGGRRRGRQSWHHQLNGREFEQAPGVGDGQGGLACCSPWGLRESDRTEQLDSNNKCGILVPPPGIEPMCPALGGRFLATEPLGSPEISQFQLLEKENSILSLSQV